MDCPWDGYQLDWDKWRFMCTVGLGLLMHCWPFFFLYLCSSGYCTMAFLFSVLVGFCQLDTGAIMWEEEYTLKMVPSDLLNWRLMWEDPMHNEWLYS